MSCEVSQKMLEAKRLVLECGLNQYQAAKKSGITRQAISMSKWYKEHKEHKRSLDKPLDIVK